MSSNIRREPQGQVLVTAALIGSLALLLAGGLNLLGLLSRLDGLIAAGLGGTLQASGFPKALPGWGLWLGTAVIAYGLSLVLLAVPGTWRRLVLWLSLLLLIAGWAPVLALASHAPTIAAPLVAGLWSGACSLVYARSRHLPCDPPSSAVLN